LKHFERLAWRFYRGPPQLLLTDLVLLHLLTNLVVVGGLVIIIIVINVVITVIFAFVVVAVVALMTSKRRGRGLVILLVDGVCAICITGGFHL
jgi:hypothetical protein